MTGKIGDTYISSKKDESSGLAYHDPSPEPSQDKLGNHSDSCSYDKFSNTPNSDENGRPRVAKLKRKRPSSPNNGPMHKKRKHHLEQRSTVVPTNIDHAPRFIGALSSLTPHWFAEGRLPSPAPSAPQTMDTEVSSDCRNLGPSFSDILPTLTEVTFRPCSTRCCSFTAVVRE